MGRRGVHGPAAVDQRLAEVDFRRRAEEERARRAPRRLAKEVLGEQ